MSLFPAGSISHADDMMEILKARLIIDEKKKSVRDTLVDYRNWLLYQLHNQKKDIGYIIDKFDECFGF